MHVIKVVVVASFVFGSFHVAALIDQSEREVTVGSNPPVKKLGPSKPAKYTNNSRIVCIDDTSIGSRIKKRRCQSVASWRVELNNQQARKYLLEM